ncbi:hypothetical protein [Brevibacillus laterosporus]|uniref:hypothetical protein n=1 Tax=Brevibacillus laterosporus TaxID=1465 RepID=UPI000B9BBE1C|nr:hypothetical protein [Brevibacillus laterosporus]MBG9788866.1 dehydrogenase [Brevibacillus laterosporus]
MDIRWHSENIAFETLREAEEWAHSIANEIYGRNYEGYITPDYKIAYVLSFRLAEVSEFRVHTKKDLANDDSVVYKVWVTLN